MSVFRHGSVALAVVAYAWILRGPASGQVPPMVPPPTVQGVPEMNPVDQSQPRQAAGSGQSAQKPLTPEEKRQKEIEKYDPLSPSNPADAVVSGQPNAPAEQTPVKQLPDRNRPAEVKPLPGSVAESNLPETTQRRDREPEVEADGDAPQDQTYNGPAVLSRSYTLVRPVSSREARWLWMVSSTEGYQTGLVSGASTANAATNGNSFFYNTSLSVSGRHEWKRDQLGLNYNLTYSNYLAVPGYNGVGQTLSTDYGHTFSRRLSLHVINTGSISPPSGTLQNPLTAPGVSVANISLSSSPSLQLLDVRTRQFQTSANLTWQKSKRLSFSMGGGFFAVDRTGYDLSGNIGYQAQADVNYRYDSRTTVGVAYVYTDYVFAQHVSVSDTHTVDLVLSRSFGHATQLRLRAGVSAIESLDYTVVPIDPAFAALIGHGSTIVDDYHKTITSDIQGQFVKDFKGKKTANISYARGVSPGNGLILTAIQETESASFSAMMFRHYSVQFTVGRTALASQAQNTGGYTSEFGSVGFSRILPDNVVSTFSLQYSSYGITNMPGLRDQLSVSTGLSWGPGPGKLW